MEVVARFFFFYLHGIKLCKGALVSTSLKVIIFTQCMKVNKLLNTADLLYLTLPPHEVEIKTHKPQLHYKTHIFPFHIISNRFTMGMRRLLKTRVLIEQKTIHFALIMTY